jgi:hypothetical protein
MHSAMIERALLPVQRNRTLKTGSIIGWAARGEIGDERRAYVGATATAVLKQEQSDFTEPGEIGTVDDRAAVPLPDDQTRAGENGEMRRHGVLRYRHKACHFARRNAFWLPLDQQPEGVQPRRLGERGKGCDCFDIIHNSRLSDIYDGCKTRTRFDVTWFMRRSRREARKKPMRLWPFFLVLWLVVSAAIWWWLESLQL